MTGSKQGATFEEANWLKGRGLDSRPEEARVISSGDRKL